MLGQAKKGLISSLFGSGFFEPLKVVRKLANFEIEPLILLLQSFFFVFAGNFIVSTPSDVAFVLASSELVRKVYVGCVQVFALELSKGFIGTNVKSFDRI